VPSPPAPPLAGRRQPSRQLRIALVVLAGLAVLFLLVQVLRSLPHEDATVDAAKAPSASSTTPQTTATTAAPTAATVLAATMRQGAALLTPANGAAAAELAGRLRTLADQVQRGDSGASTAATALIIDVAKWRQAGQLDDGATLGAVQLLQQVPGVVVAGSATATPTTAAQVVPSGPVKAKPGKDKK
jgi:hypothetical protein